MELEIEILKPFLQVNHTYPDFTMNMYSFICLAKSKKFKLNVHKDFKWLSINKLKTLDWAPADMPIVDKLINKK